MLNIYVLDITAESRNKIIQEINGFVRDELPDNFLIPRINLKPIALSEIKFHAAPDVCIVGNEFVTMELGELANLRKILPHSAILVKTKAALENIAVFEQFARLGVDDTLPENISALEFFRKIILLAKGKKKDKSGQLIVVESAKGGLGATSVAAAIGEVLLEQDKKVLLVDLDSETQDLSRFLQVKPYVNENLQLLIDQQRPVSEETVMQCAIPVWQDENGLYCMPPIADTEDIYDSRSLHAKIFLSIFDLLDQLFDYVIVDIAGVRGSLARTLHRVADRVICLVNNDPASLFAASQKIQRIRSGMSVNAELKILECSPYKHALPSNLVKTEISRSAKVSAEDWLPNSLPYCVHASRWPGSGNTVYSAGGRALIRALLSNLEALGVVVQRKERKKFKWAYVERQKHTPVAQTNGLQKQIENDEKLKLPGPDELVSSATFDSEKGRTDLHENGEIIRDNKEEEPLVSNVFIN